MRRRVQTFADDSLAAARRRFERWRKVRGSGGRIPHELWMAAVKAAAMHGAEAVAVDLGVDLDRLRHWMRSVDSGQPEAPPATFVELPPLPRVGVAGMADASNCASECTLELEEPSGRRLRILLKGAATTQALELGRALWRASP